MSVSESSGTGPAKIVQLDDRRSDPPTEKTKIFGGGSGGGGMLPVDSETKNYLDAKMDTVKAQNDARFTDVNSKLDRLVTLIETAPKPLGFWQLAGMAATSVVALITLLGVFADRFDGGISAFGLLDEFMKTQAERDAGQDARLERLLVTIEERSNQPQQGQGQGQK